MANTAVLIALAMLIKIVTNAAILATAACATNAANAIANSLKFSAVNLTAVPRALPIVLARLCDSPTTDPIDLETSVNAEVSPPSPTSFSARAKLSCKFDKAPLSVLLCLSMEPANSTLPTSFKNCIIERPSFSIVLAVPLKLTVSLSPSVLTLIPNCLSISNSPVVALNTACDTSSKRLPIPAAMLPMFFIKPSVGCRPAFLNVINALVTSSSWNVVPAVNCLISSKLLAAFLASPSMVTKVCLRSWNVLIVFTSSLDTNATARALKAVPNPPMRDLRPLRLSWACLVSTLTL